MKVLHVNDYGFRRGVGAQTGDGGPVGGCEVLVQTTMDLLRDVGVETALFTAADVPGHARTARTYLSNGRAGRALLERIESWRPDVVHLHNFYHELSPSILGALARLRAERSGVTAAPARTPGGAPSPPAPAPAPRVVMTAHDFHLVCPNSGLCTFRGGAWETADLERLPRWGYLLSHRWDHRRGVYSLLKLAQHAWHYRLRDHRDVIDLVICPSRFMCSALSPLGRPLRLVPNPAPAPPPATARPEDELGWVFAGRLEPEKGMNEFLRGLPTRFPGRLTVVGAGSELEPCRATCYERGFTDRVEFTGRVSSLRARRLIAGAHVLVLPSLCPENAPMALLEALSAGTHVLVSDRGGMREIVEESGAGTTFEPDDPASLAHAVALITRRFEEGTLNAGPAASYLDARDETAYRDGVMRAYRDELSDPATDEITTPLAGGIPDTTAATIEITAGERADAARPTPSARATTP